MEAFARPRPLLEGVQAVGTPMTVLPAVFHALWHGSLTVSLDSPLHQGVLVGPGPVRAVAGSGEMGTAGVAGDCGGGGV